MPERNLVPALLETRAIFSIIVVAVSLGHSGCSKIGTKDFSNLLNETALVSPTNFVEDELASANDQLDSEAGSKWQREERDLQGVLLDDEPDSADSTLEAAPVAAEPAQFKFSEDVPDYVPPKSVTTPNVAAPETTNLASIPESNRSENKKPLSPILFDGDTREINNPQPDQSRNLRAKQSARRSDSPTANPAKSPLTHSSQDKAEPSATSEPLPLTLPPPPERTANSKPPTPTIVFDQDLPVNQADDVAIESENDFQVKQVSANLNVVETPENIWEPPALPQATAKIPDAPKQVAKSEDSVTKTPPLSASAAQEIQQATAWTDERRPQASVDFSSMAIELPEPHSPRAPTLTPAEHLEQTIQSLKHDLQTSAQPSDGLAVSLRLLEMLQRKIHDVSSSQQTLSVDEDRYWQAQLETLAIMLGTQTVSTAEDSDLQQHELALQALDHLDRATDQLRSIAGLQINGGHFCTEISGFGQYQTFESNEFQVGDRALLYVEVDNFHSHRHDNPSEGPTWRTKLHASYAVYDQQGRAVQQEAFPIIEDVARNRRRDFYLHLPLTIGDLPVGRYQLQIMVEDIAKTASASMPSVEFIVR